MELGRAAQALEEQGYVHGTVEGSHQTDGPVRLRLTDAGESHLDLLRTAAIEKIVAPDTGRVSDIRRHNPAMTEPELVMINIGEWAEFGPAMRMLRQSRGLSVARLAEQSGVARAKVEAIETGGEPTPDELAQLLFALQPGTFLGTQLTAALNQRRDNKKEVLDTGGTYVAMPTTPPTVVRGPPARGAPTTFLSWAHAPNDGVDEQDWADVVHQLAQQLAAVGGLPVEADFFHDGEPIAWGSWGPRQISLHEKVLVCVNAAWKRRFEGLENPRVGAGAAAEADQLLGLYERDREALLHKIVVVVLPGASSGDIPDRLRGSVTRVDLTGRTAFDLEALTPLLRLLTGQGSRRPAAPAVAVPTFVPRDPDVGALGRAAGAVQPEPTPNEQQRWSSTPTAPASADGRVARARAGLDEGRSWLAITAVPTSTPAVTHRLDARSQRQRVQEWLVGWQEQTSPLLPMDLGPVGLRVGDRVVVTGPARQVVAEQVSLLWRIELGDDAGGLVAVPVIAQGGSSIEGPAGEVSAVGALLVQPLPRDRLELAVLTAVELLIGHAEETDPEGTMHGLQLQARLLPSPPEHFAARVDVEQTEPAGHVLRLGDSPRHPDGLDVPQDGTLVRVAGVTDRPVVDIDGDVVPVPRTSACDGADLVRISHAVVLRLIEHLGADSTTVLTADGTLRARAAAVADQQLVHQHARHHGLAVETRSPVELRGDAEDLRRQAVELLTPPSQ